MRMDAGPQSIELPQSTTYSSLIELLPE